MDLKESAELGDLAGAHWYYRSKAAAVGQFLNGTGVTRVLDVGAGSGFFTKHLLAEGATSLGVCVDTGYEADRDEQFAGKPLQFRRSCGPIDADLVLLMDVLEHVDDDAAMLRDYASKVPTGTAFLITVPAFQWLWSGHDVFLEHRRRYTIGTLEAAVRRAGLEVERSSYYFGLVLPLAATMRVTESVLNPGAKHTPRSQLKRHHWLTNFVLSTICRTELPFFRANKVGGLSVFCLARKA